MISTCYHVLMCNVILSLVKTMFTAHTTICSGSCPCQTNVASIEISECEQVGETIVIMIETGKLV